MQAKINSYTWKDYFIQARECNQIYGTNFRTDINVAKQTKTVAKANIDRLKAYLLKAVENQYGKTSLFYAILKGNDDVWTEIGGSTSGKIYSFLIGLLESEDAGDSQWDISFKFNDDGELILLTE